MTPDLTISSSVRASDAEASSQNGGTDQRGGA